MSREKWEEMRRFTMIFYDVYGYGVKLKVANQYFTVAPAIYKTLEEAEGMQTQLCKALARINEEVRNER